MKAGHSKASTVIDAILFVQQHAALVDADVLLGVRGGLVS